MQNTLLFVSNAENLKFNFEKEIVWGAYKTPDNTPQYCLSGWLAGCAERPKLFDERKVQSKKRQKKERENR
jgi:hypothetical protein